MELSTDEHTPSDRLSRNAGFSNPVHNVHLMGVREGMHVAEFGAGSGAYVAALAQRVGPSGAVYAVDVQRDLLNRIATAATESGQEHVHAVWGDIEEVDGVGIRDGLLDMVLIANTLFLMDEKNRALQEAWRVLKESGTLVIIDWKDSYSGLGPKQKDVVTPTTAVVLATDNGFAMKQQFDAGEHHYGLVCAKMMKDTGATRNTHQDTDAFVTRTVEQEMV